MAIKKVKYLEIIKEEFVKRKITNIQKWGPSRTFSLTSYVDGILWDFVVCEPDKQNYLYVYDQHLMGKDVEIEGLEKRCGWREKDSILGIKISTCKIAYTAAAWIINIENNPSYLFTQKIVFLPNRLSDTSHYLPPVSGKNLVRVPEDFCKEKYFKENTPQKGQDFNMQLTYTDLVLPVVESKKIQRN